MATDERGEMTAAEALAASKAGRREADHTLANAIVAFAETRIFRTENHWAAKTALLFKGEL